jgi:hypothetical protein
MPGSTYSLKEAVKNAKNVNVTNLSKTLFENNNELPHNEIPDHFIKHFENNIKNILSHVNINNGVYNGVKKLKQRIKTLCISSLCKSVCAVLA